MKKLLLALALTGIAASANASLVSVDRLTTGDGQITRDTATNLDWLDLSLTYNQTVASVLPKLAAGQAYDGFHLALESEVHTLMTDGGLPISNSTTNLPASASQLSAASALTALLGDTLNPQYGEPYHGSRGHLTYNGQDLVVGFYKTGSTTSLFNDHFSGYPTWLGAGVWLVRSSPVNAVPEPGSLSLIGLALAGMIAAKRRKTSFD